MNNTIYKHQKANKKFFALILIATFIVQLISPLINYNSSVYAETSNGFTVQQIINKSSIRAGEQVEVKLKYATSGDDNFYNTKIFYTLPYGAVLNSIKANNTVTHKVDSTNRIITFSLESIDKDNNKEGFMRSGQSGDILIYFTIPGPKNLYPNGKQIKFNKNALAKANVKSSDGVAIEFYAVAPDITYIAPPKWNIRKTTKNNRISISKDTNITHVTADYSIIISGGDCDLKDVTVTDILPQNAIVENASGGTEIADGNTKKLKWHFDDIGYNKTKKIDITLKFPIDGRISGVAGVNDGDTRINKVVITGYPTDYDTNGQRVKASNPYLFLNGGKAQVTTNFELSKKTWGVYTSGDILKKIPLNPSETKVVVRYLVGFTNGDRGIKNVTLSYEIPNDATVENADGGSTINRGGKQYIEWSESVLAANTSYSKNVILSYPIDRTSSGTGVKDKSERTNTVSANGVFQYDDSISVVFNPNTDSVTTKFIEDDVKWVLSKTATSQVTIPHDNSVETSEVVYVIKLDSQGDNPATNLPLKSVTITDNLPTGAILQSSIPVKDSSSSDTTPTWTFTNIDPSNTSSWPKVTVKVKYPINRYTSSTGVIEGSTLENEAIVVATINDSKNTPYQFKKTSSKATTTFVKKLPPEPRVILGIENYSDNTSDVKYRHFDKGDSVVYTLDFQNIQHRNHKLETVNLIGENFPDDIDFNKISTGEANKSVNFKLWYKTDNDTSTWIEYSPSTALNTSSNTEITKAELDNANKIIAFKIQYLEDVPTGFNYTQKIKLHGNVNTSVVDKQQISYSFRATGEYLGFENNDSFSIQDSIAFTIRLKTAWIAPFNKTIYKHNQVDYSKPDAIGFQINVTNKERWATSPLKKPVIIDILPYGIEFVSWNNKWGSDVTLTEYKNVPEEGKTTLVWTFNKDLAIGETWSIKYDTKVANYAIVGDYTNKIYLMSEGQYHWKNSILNESVTSLDINNDNDKTDSYIEGDGKTIKIRKTAALDATKWVRGELDYRDNISNPENGFRFRDNKGNLVKGRSTPGGAADYSLRVKNVGSTLIKKIELIDILPRINDTRILNQTSRQSKWTPYLIESLKSGKMLAVTDYFGNKKNARVDIYYSKAYDPIRRNSDGNNIGSQQPEWTSVPPSDLTEVKSIKFDVWFFDEAGDTYYLKPDSEVRIDWRMRAPLGAPTDSSVAWNTVGTYGTYIYNNHDYSLVWNEPAKVGMKVEENPYASIGDFVWFDKNGDGKQNDGYDNENAGLNGITVNLYKRRSNEAKWKKVDTTLTGNDFNGKPGYYLFPSLDSGEYFVSFEIPNYYKTTLLNNGNDDIDSDGKLKDIAACNEDIHTKIISLKGDKNESNYNLDLGLVKSDSIKVTPSLDITKKATHYQEVGKISKIPIGDPKISLNKGETIIYSVTVENDCRIPITNITLEDERNNAYFVLTPAQQTDNVVYDRNLTSNKLKIKKLMPGEKYDFECKYIITESDLNMKPLENTVSVWANELKDKSDKDPYKSVKETIQIADLALDKKVVRIKKKDGSTIPVTDSSTVGVEYGDILTYRLTVTNVGSVDLTDISVKDNKIIINKVSDSTKWAKISDTEQKITLKSGESAWVEGDYTVKNTDKNVIKNTATATNGKIRTSRDTATNIYFKGIVLTKEVKSINGKAPVIIGGKPVANVGDTILYEVTFTNTDKTTLRNVRIVKDELITSYNNEKPRVILKEKPNPVDLKPTESKKITYPYIVSEQDINKIGMTKAIINKVAGRSDFTKTRKAEAIVELAHLQLTKEADKSTFSTGQKITYTIKVKNKGSIPLHNVIVTDAMLGINKTNTGNIGDLAVEQEVILKGTYKATKEDYKKGKIENTVTAISDETPIKESKVVINRYVHTTPNKPAPKKEPNISINKSADKITAKVGESINYSITVTNVGNVKLTNVVVSDNMLGINDTISTLDISETRTYTGTYTATKSDEATGKIINVATVSSNETSTKQDQHTVYITKDKDKDKEEKDKEKDKDKQKEDKKDEEKKDEEKKPKEKDIIEKKEKEVDNTTKIIPKDKVKPKEIVEKPKHGKVDIDEEGNIIYTPDEGYKGKDTFKVKVINEDGEEIVMEIDIEDDEVARGGFKLPETGRKIPSPYYPVGFSMIALGLYLTIKKKK